jgi:hypothetical protein
MIRQLQTSKSVSEVVVEAVSATENSPPTSLPPLYNTVDPDALDMIFKETENDTSDRIGYISFQYSDSVVTIGKNGYLSVHKSQRF